jgi:integrase
LVSISAAQAEVHARWLGGAAQGAGGQRLLLRAGRAVSSPETDGFRIDPPEDSAYWVAGITDRSGPHVLRHTFATHALRARPNIRAVQELLGHAWVTTTQRYGHLEVEDLQAQLAEMPGNGFRG